MTRLQACLLTVSLVMALGARISAQPEPTPAEADTVTVSQLDPSTCGKPEAAPEEASSPVPVTWNDFDLAGNLVDPAPTVRSLLAPTLNRHRALTEDARGEITRAATAFGYHVVGLGTRDTPTGTHLTVHLAPMPMVRHVRVSIEHVSFKRKLLDTFLDDEVRRRMRVRPGVYLAWSPKDRACELYEETRRIEEFLRDEGFFEARATIGQSFGLENTAVTLKVKVELGPEYKTALDKIQFPDAGRLPVNVSELREAFEHRKCFTSKYLCSGTQRFTRAQHQADVQRIMDLFHARGFPAVRVRSDFDPGMSIDRRTKTVSFAITIDPRRRLDIVFEGERSPTDATLRQQLTFDKAASADDVEANDSARAIAAYLQSRGYFDARVTWIRERFSDGEFDRLIYRIDQGKSRTVRSVGFTGNRVLSSDALSEIIGTKQARLSTSLFGANTAATSALLAEDVERLVELYRRTGYRDARVKVSASTDPGALGSAALTAALVAADRGRGLYVRFSIDEGQPTLLTEVRIAIGDHGDALTTADERALCTRVLHDLAELYHHDLLAQQATPDRCVANAVNLPYKEDAAADTRDLLKDRLFSRGRPRAEVDYAPVVLGPHSIAAQYKLSSIQELKVGKVVIRGNFRTRDSIIRHELNLTQGQALTKDVLAEAARRLRNTGLFDAVNIAMPDLDTASAGEVNAVVEITERFDYFASADAEFGYSSYNGAFVKLIPSVKNLFGVGISLDVAGTIGFDLWQLVDQSNVQLRQLSLESTLRFPKYWSSRYLHVPELVAFSTELTAFHRRQDTPRFGLLKTTGATLGISRTWDRPRLGK
ncbi:MAG: surface antigen, partial [Deltaproteobacteria bacterium]|nr:surface antigen [Deltaproteobacteria bacterium]